jgi:hypothetical protein
MTNLVNDLADEASRIEEDSLYSSRGHFAAATGWSRIHYWIGIPAAICAAAAGGSGFADQPALAGVLSIITAILSALAVFLNPQDKASQHHAAGSKLAVVRNQARMFRNLEIPALDSTAALARLRDLGDLRDSLNTTSPAIPEWAFRKAQSSIGKGEATHAVDEKAAPPKPK